MISKGIIKWYKKFIHESQNIDRPLNYRAMEMKCTKSLS